jgi:uncharacterized OB-fold protein
MMSIPRYWREIPKRTRFEVAKCGKCGNVNYPPRGRCDKCGSFELLPYKLPEKGKLVSFTVVRSPPKGFERLSPYLLGIVELEDGTRVTSQLTDTNPKDATIGMSVEAVFRKISEDGDAGIIQYALKFRPAFK